MFYLQIESNDFILKGIDFTHLTQPRPEFVLLLIFNN